MRFDSHVEHLLSTAAALVNLQVAEPDTRDRASEDPRPASACLEDALAHDGLRAALSDDDVAVLRRFAVDARGVFDAAADEDLELAAHRVNALLAWTRPRPLLDQHTDGWNLHFHGPTDRPGDGWAAGCAAALAMVVGSADRGRLGVCEAPGCERVYVDRSKNSSRRFCSLACQNRVKNASHRARARHGRA